MAKTQLFGAARVGRRTFTTNAKPDTYDLRDLEYRPVLQPLDPVVHADRNDAAFRVLTQEGSSCTGHALAAAINTVRVRQAAGTPAARSIAPVSPYMLYRLARRYDEFPGEADVGSSLRGAFKGWLRHGVALDREWNEKASDAGVTPVDAEIDIDEPDFVTSCRQLPLGAYFRVNQFRLDDMQSAISELHAITASAAVHDGWQKPRRVTRDGETFAVIARSARPEPIGGHAFALVGYNEIGFLVQNSWGEDWGDHGFAILSYEDWLLSAYDAWVARPGVPNTPFARPPSSSAQTSTGEVVVRGGPNLLLLRNYVVNTGNDGRLSDHGKMVSTLPQVDDVFANMRSKHADWIRAGETTTRDVVLYAHGGLVDENGGLTTAERMLPHWLDHRVYPINFAWESGALETILDALNDLLQGKLPFGFEIRFDVEEAIDRLVEGIARNLGPADLWGQMKGNAIGASEAGSGTAGSDIRGGTLVARKLAAYVGSIGDPVRIHLAGHSAGSIFLTALVPRLLAEDVDISSLAFMGAAVRSDVFARDVLPAIGPNGRVKRFATFNLSERFEQDDTCDIGGRDFYHKSLLYLVARGLEPDPDPKTGVVPLVGLEASLDRPLPSGSSLRQSLDGTGSKIVIAPGGTSQDLRSDAKGHGDFDNDQATLNAILLRMLRLTSLPSGSAGTVGLGDESARATARPSTTKRAPRKTVEATRPTRSRPTSETSIEGARMGVSFASGPPRAVPVRRHLKPARTSQVPTEAAIAPKSGSPGLDMLLASGWKEIKRR
jgi:hypothetical protein